MNLEATIKLLMQHVTPFNVIVVILLLASEVLGTNENIKASSIFGLLRALVNTLKDQALPKPAAQPVIEPTVATPTVASAAPASK